jgi:ribonuclease HII
MTRLPLAQIRRRFVTEARPLDVETEAALKADSRPGARAILNAVARRRAENRSEGQRLRKLLQFETALWASGIVQVAGVDEAGMSPLAGPVAAAAVVFAPGSRNPGVDDSKKLDVAARDRLAVEIKQQAVAWSVAFAQVEEIDRINIYWAGLLAMRRAVEGLSLPPQHILLDARRLRELPIPATPSCTCWMGNIRDTASRSTRAIPSASIWLR